MVSYIQLAPLTYINLVPLPLTVLHLLQILYRAALGTLPMRTMQHKAKQAWVCNAVFILKQMLWTSLYLLSITLTDLAKSTVDMLQNDLLHSKYLSINEYPSCHSAYIDIHTSWDIKQKGPYSHLESELLTHPLHTHCTHNVSWSFAV